MNDSSDSDLDKATRIQRIRELSDRLNQISEEAKKVSGEAQDAQLKQMAELIERTRMLISKFTKQ